MVGFTVPGQPQGKGRAKIVKIGGFSRMATPPKTVAYEGLIAHAAQTALAGRPLLDGPVGLTLILDCQVPASWSAKKQRAALAGEHMPTTKPDADNVEKLVLDAGTKAGLWEDDTQVAELVVRRVRAARGEGPSTRIAIALLSGLPPESCR